jgi:hypothetical protein
MKTTKEEIERWTPEEYAETDVAPPEGTRAVFTDPDRDDEIIGYEGLDYSYLFPDEDAAESWLSGEEAGLKLEENKIRIKKSQIKQAIMEMLSEQSERRPPTKLEMNLIRLLNNYTVTDIFDENVDYKKLFESLKGELENIVNMSLGDE